MPNPVAAQFAFAVTRLLGMRFRIPPGAWISVSLVRRTAEYGVSKRDREASIKLRRGPLGAIASCKKKIYHRRNYEFVKILSKLNL
jgi:hypothetical protein